MALLPNFKRITTEDIPDSPKWLPLLLTPLNSFMQSVYSALSKNINLTDNVAGQYKELTFSTSSTYNTGDFTPIQFIYTPKSQPLGLEKLYCVEKSGNFVILGPVDVSWFYSNGQINIMYVHGLNNSKDYTLRVFVYSQ